MSEIDVTQLVNAKAREFIIKSLVDLVPKQFVQAVILRLLVKDDVSRAILITEVGEAAVQDHMMDPQGYDQRSWDEIGMKVINELLDTPGGRGEVE